MGVVVLGIETSCDETAAAVVQDGNILLSNVVLSSMDLHVIYGGVVPEIAARSHIESIIPVIDQALSEAFSPESTKSEARNNKQATSSLDTNYQPLTPIFDPWSKIDAIAVTYGAGLGGSLLVGVMSAKTLAIAKNKPLYAINHVEGHVYANFLTEVGRSKVKSQKQKTLRHSTNSFQINEQEYTLPSKPPEFPMLALIVSGGHSQLVLFRNHFDYTLLGQTRDDAIGEAFDKVAKITGLPYPGGPSIAKAAVVGDAYKYSLPKAKLDGENEALQALREEYEVRGTGLGQKTSHSVPRTSYDFSFSGLKTAVLRLTQELVGEDYTFPSHKLPERLSETQVNDIAASFQCVAIETVVDKTVLAFKEFQPKSVVIAGGVAANQELRRQLSDKIPIPVQYPDIKLCTDNAAMIASLGCFKVKYNQPTANPYSLEIAPNLSM